MASILKDYDFPNGAGRGKYPWEAWEDGEIRLLKQGEDFDSSIASMTSSIYGRAKKQGLTAKVAKESDSELVIQFVS